MSEIAVADYMNREWLYNSKSIMVDISENYLQKWMWNGSLGGGEQGLSDGFVGGNKW